MGVFFGRSTPDTQFFSIFGGNYTSLPFFSMPTNCGASLAPPFFPSRISGTFFSEWRRLCSFFWSCSPVRRGFSPNLGGLAISLALFSHKSRLLVFFFLEPPEFHDTRTDFPPHTRLVCIRRPEPLRAEVFHSISLADTPTYSNSLPLLLFFGSDWKYALDIPLFLEVSSLGEILFGDRQRIHPSFAFSPFCMMPSRFPGFPSRRASFVHVNFSFP